MKHKAGKRGQGTWLMCGGGLRDVIASPTTRGLMGGAALGQRLRDRLRARAGGAFLDFRARRLLVCGRVPMESVSSRPRASGLAAPLFTVLAVAGVAAASVPFAFR